MPRLPRSLIRAVPRIRLTLRLRVRSSVPLKTGASRWIFGMLRRATGTSASSARLSLNGLDPLRRPEGEIHDGTGIAIVYVRNAALLWF